MAQPNRPAYTLKFFDQSDNLEGIITSNAGFSPMSEAEFDVTMRGSGQLQFDLSYLPDFEIYHFQFLKIYLWNQTEPYWSGFVTLVPGNYQSDNVWNFRALGFPTYLGSQVYLKEFDSTLLDTRLKEFLQDFDSGQSTLNYNASKVTFNSTPLAYLLFIMTQTDEVVRAFERIAGSNWVIGVDHDRDLTFTGFTDTSITADRVLVVGREIMEWKPETDSSEVFNYCIVKMGGINENSASDFYKTNFTGQIEQDATSISNYGLRAKVVTAPNALHQNDAQKYAQTELAANKDPKPNNPAQKVLYDGRRWEPGKWFRILLPDGTSEEYQLVRIRYKISDNMIECMLYLGSDDQTLARLQDSLERTQANAEYARHASQTRFQITPTPP